MELQQLQTALRNKYTFTTLKGTLYVQDLYDLALPTLKTLGNSLNQMLKELKGDESSPFGDDKSARELQEINILQNKIDIVVHIYNTKKTEVDAATKAQETKAHNQKILALIAQKKEGQLADMSVEDLEKMLQ